MRIWVVTVLLGVFLHVGQAHAASEDVDPTKKYLFFLHDEIIEVMGHPARSKRYGHYKYDALRNKLASGGYVLRSELRAKGTDVIKYADTIAAQIKTLLVGGVPARNIGVVGSSKGGRIALRVSSIVNSHDIRYAILSGCLDDDIEKHGLQPNGRILSLLDSADDTYGSCAGVFMGGKRTLSAKEVVLTEGLGGGLFYKPRSVWLKPTLDWIKQ